MSWKQFSEDDGHEISIIGISLMALNEDREECKIHLKIDEPDAKPYFMVYIKFRNCDYPYYGSSMNKCFIMTDGNTYNDTLLFDYSKLKKGLRLGKLAKTVICNTIMEYVNNEE